MKTLVLGLGNELYGDDGVGLHVVRFLRDEINSLAFRPSCYQNVFFEECALTGLALLDVIEGYDRLIIVDTIKRSHPKAGKVYHIDGKKLRHIPGPSPHYVSIPQTIDIGREAGLKMPESVEIIAVEAKNIYDLGEGLTEEMQKSIPEIIETIKKTLQKNPDEKGESMEKKEVLVLKDLLGSNKKIASEIREQLQSKGILTLNFLSSPGTGKTSLLEKIADKLSSNYKMAVIEGDIETERDAERIRAKGIPAWQITTGGACHLEAKMIGRLFPEIPPDLDFLFIENIGNLVCPASYDLGESIRCVLLSIPEGDDKPKKYPKAFTTSDCLIITKADLVPALPFRIEQAKKEALEMNPRLKTFVTSSTQDSGIDELMDYFISSLKKLRQKNA
ncbi:MAG: hydrogenase nickel incorporation protein HypB [Candidatus Aminicenantes bacterium]|nr:hydrogenase nickel incorporation protein HypB [Candidatus Aminicenantes bacterium]